MRRGGRVVSERECEKVGRGVEEIKISAKLDELAGNRAEMDVEGIRLSQIEEGTKVYAEEGRKKGNSKYHKL